ncbi:MAG: hypothetical protein AAF639_29860 [Chloroflexota bacterium]
MNQNEPLSRIAQHVTIRYRTRQKILIIGLLFIATSLFASTSLWHQSTLYAADQQPQTAQIASDPIPLQQETWTSRNPTLIWSGQTPSDDLAYTVAFGTSNPPAVIGTVTQAACNPSGGSGGLPVGTHDTTIAGRPATVIVGTGYDPATPTKLAFYLHGDEGGYDADSQSWSEVNQFINANGWIYVAPQAPQTDFDPGNEAWRWYDSPESNADLVAQVLDEMFAKYNVCQHTLFGATASGGSVFYDRSFFPLYGERYPAHVNLHCGGGLSEQWPHANLSIVRDYGQSSEMVARNHVKYTYGSDDFLADQVRNAVSFYTSTGLRVVQDERAGVGHCAYDWQAETAAYFTEMRDALSTQYAFMPGQLADNTTYYWRVTENDAGTINIGTVWEFTTAPNVIYVDADANGVGDGRSWGNAFTDLQSALTAARSAGEAIEIWVAEGTYRPTDNTTDRTATFQLVNNVTIYGGFNGTELSLSQRNPTDNPTILSGDLQQNDSNNIDPSEPTRAENSYRVVTAGTATNSITSGGLDGVVITGGNASGDTWETSRGAGLYNNGGEFTLNNVIFLGNVTSSSGAGMYNANATPTITSALFSGNRAAFAGGGLYHQSDENEPLVVTDSIFSKNEVYLYETGVGAAVYNAKGRVSIVDSIIWGNVNHCNPNDQVQISIGKNAPEVAAFDVSDTVIQDGYAGHGNTSDDPNFLDADGADGIPGTLDDDLRYIGSSAPAGDCNGDISVGAADITALALEFFDGDGTSPADTSSGSYPGVPTCDANEDDAIGASDLTCIGLIFFNGEGACTLGAGEGLDGTSQLGQKPALSLPTTVLPLVEGELILPVQFNNGLGDEVGTGVSTGEPLVGSLIFSLDYDETMLAFDATDTNEDGIPDAIVDNLPAGYSAMVFFDADDASGELDFVVTNFSNSPTPLDNGKLFDITLTAVEELSSGDGAIESFVRFSANVPASFGTITGHTIDGRVENEVATVVIEPAPSSATEPINTEPADTVPGSTTTSLFLPVILHYQISTQ